MGSGDKEEAGGGVRRDLPGLCMTCLEPSKGDVGGGVAMPENQASSLSNRENSCQRYTWETCQREDVI